MKKTAFAAIVGALALAAAPAVAAPPTADAVLKHYGDLAQAMYTDSLTTAKDLQVAIDGLTAKPTEDNLMKARAAWKAARVPYMQTEGYRFGNAIVDDWEGKVNAWPLDEGLIDYVDTASYGDSSEENPLYTANVIANTKIQLGNETIDASTINVDLLHKLHEAGGSEANVATGYHAIEFLLWGQDLNGTGPGAGNRPYTDYDTKACTGGHCDRRAAYLKTAAALLVSDLQEMAADWAPDGAARNELAAKGVDGGLVTILTGLGSLSYGELAGERMKLGLILHDPEEEHDCFSDNTHNSHYYDEVGMHDIYTGKYTRIDGKVLSGPSLAEYAAAKAAEANKKLNADFEATLAAMKVLKDTADSGKMAYDQMLAADNKEGNAIVQKAVDALVTQAKGVEDVVAALGLKIEVEGSDSLDNPSAVVAQ
jgi:putative iron-regulated protein